MDNEEKRKKFMELVENNLTPHQFKTKLIQEFGWHILTKQVNDEPFEVTFFESIDDYEIDDVLTESHGFTSDEAIQTGLNNIKFYYKTKYEL